MNVRGFLDHRPGDRHAPPAEALEPAAVRFWEDAAIEYQLSFTVTPDLIKAATRRFWLQFVGWGGLLRWAIVSIALIVLSILGRQTWSYGMAALVIVLIPSIWVGGYFTFLRRALHRYGRMQSKLISYHFTEQGLGTRSDLGSAETPWRMLDKVQRYPDVWLLFFGRRDYAYLPATEMTEQLKGYILQQVGRHDVKGV